MARINLEYHQTDAWEKHMSIVFLRHVLNAKGKISNRNSLVNFSRG